ncbi:hypothetical protein C0993_000978 [Termitomyces sp. T159_Od127]|nr:hypothetical protein C0993_000978 [Termitomyces sp. T159_Od127]
MTSSNISFVDKFEAGQLGKKETFWRDHYNFLKDRGYTLRNRYSPDWVPSWKSQKNSSKSWRDCEDGQLIHYARVVDAVRADGSLVVLKEIEIDSNPEEIPIGKLFSSETLAKHPKNHCVPFLDVIEPFEGSGLAFVVMPYLLKTVNPPFETIGEVVAYFRQIFEGLEFMHNNHVSHGDCKADNFMGDTVSLFKHPPHPSTPYMRRDYRGEVSLSTSRTKKPVKYYLIDFGLSKVCRPEDAPHFRPPPWGGDKSVPEFSLPEAKPCDPFPVDVYCMGNSIRRYYTDGWDGFVKRKQGFDFMEGLIDDMTNSDPQKRPSMTDVVLRFEEIIKGLDDKKLRSPVLDVGEKLGAFRKISHWTTQWINKLRGIPAIPST